MSRDSIVVSAKDQVFSDLGGKVAILDLKVGVYYGLDEVGANEVLTVARGHRSSARLYKARDSTEVLRLTHFPPVVLTRT